MIEKVSGEVVGNVHDAVQSVNEMVLSRNIADAICKKYPIEQGHQWGIHVNAEQGVCYIYNFNLSSKWGFTLKLADLVNDPRLTKAVQAAGEILERYNIRRARIGNIDNDLGQLQKDFTGENCFDGHCALKFGRQVKSKVATRKPTRTNTPHAPVHQPLVFS